MVTEVVPVETVVPVPGVKPCGPYSTRQLKLRSAYSSGLSIFHANSAVAKVTSVQLNPYTTGVQVTSVT